MLNLQDRRKHCEDTIARSSDIVKDTFGGSLRSEFMDSQLPALQKTDSSFPNLMLQPIEIHNSDAFALARTLKPTVGKIGVLNLASDREPGGGWRYTLSATQEEALCYSSTLYPTLTPERYPWPNTGTGSCAGFISPDVVVFKDTLDNNLVDLPVQQRQVLAVLTIAAPCLPRVTKDGENFLNESDLNDLKEKILLTLRLAARGGLTNLVLGAMGCGAYGCPPRAVAKEMKATLELEEFTGWFETVVFAVYAAGPTAQRNLHIFRDVFAHA